MMYLALGNMLSLLTNISFSDIISATKSETQNLTELFEHVGFWIFSDSVKSVPHDGDEKVQEKDKGNQDIHEPNCK